jgi:hypothetical protein
MFAREAPDPVKTRQIAQSFAQVLGRNSNTRNINYDWNEEAKVIKVERSRRPEKSDHNPSGIEERTYKEMRAFDYSITPRPHYASATVALRSITE